MELITPFEFVSMFPENRTLAIIGNASSVRTSGRGEYIDQHDVVVRFNECALDGFEADVGGRTDILVSNPYAENRPRPLLDGRRARVLLILAPQTRRGDAAVFEQWARGHRVLFSYTPALVGVPDSTHTMALTTGTYAIHLLARLLQPSRIFLTGFTLFAGKDSTHYFASSAPPGLKAHDINREAVIYCNILNSIRTSIVVTEDVLGIFGRAGINPSRQVTSLTSGKRARPGWLGRLWSRLAS